MIRVDEVWDLTLITCCFTFFPRNCRINFASFLGSLGSSSMFKEEVEFWFSPMTLGAGQEVANMGRSGLFEES